MDLPPVTDLEQYCTLVDQLAKTNARITELEQEKEKTVSAKTRALLTHEISTLMGTLGQLRAQIKASGFGSLKDELASTKTQLRDCQNGLNVLRSQLSDCQQRLDRLASYTTITKLVNQAIESLKFTELTPSSGVSPKTVDRVVTKLNGLTRQITTDVPVSDQARVQKLLDKLITAIQQSPPPFLFESRWPIAKAYVKLVHELNTLAAQ